MAFNAAALDWVNVVGLEYAPPKRSANRLDIDDDAREIIAASDVFRRAGMDLGVFGNTLFSVVDAANNGLLHFRDFGLSYRELSNVYRLAVELQPTLRKKSPFRLMKQGDFFDIEAAGYAIAKKAGHLLGDIDDKSARHIVNALYGINFDVGFVRKLREIYSEITKSAELIETAYRSAPMDFDSDYLNDCGAVAAVIDNAPLIKQTDNYDPSQVIGEYKIGMGRKLCRIDAASRKEAYLAFKECGGVKKRKASFIFNRDFATYIGFDKDIADSYLLMGSAERAADQYRSLGIDISESTVRSIAKGVLGDEYRKIASSRKALFKKSTI